MMAIALVGLPFSGRETVAEGLGRKGFITFPISELMLNFDAVQGVLKSMGGNLVVPDVTTPEQVQFLRSNLGAQVLGVRASTGTRLERAQKGGVLDGNADFRALDELDTTRGYDHALMREIDEHLDAVIITDIQEDRLHGNVEKLVMPRMEGSASPERG